MALWFRARWLGKIVILARFVRLANPKGITVSAIQRDHRWPALLAELTARGFRVNTSEPEYLAKAMGLYITAPCVGDGNAYSMSDSLNQAIFNAVMSERWGAAWSSTYLEAGRKHWPALRSSNYDFRRKDPRFCIPERADGVPDCAVAGGGVVGMQAPNAYPNEYNASLITPALVKYFGFPVDRQYLLRPILMSTYPHSF